MRSFVGIPADMYLHEIIKDGPSNVFLGALKQHDLALRSPYALRFVNTAKNWTSSYRPEFHRPAKRRPRETARGQLLSPEA